MVAIELYRVMKQIKELEKELENLEEGSQGRGEIEKNLRQARSEQDRLKNMIEGAKGD